MFDVLCQNFVGLGWIVCPQPQYEVVVLFPAKAKLKHCLQECLSKPIELQMPDLSEMIDTLMKFFIFHLVG